MFAWNVVPPMVGNLGAIVYPRHVSLAGDRRAGLVGAVMVLVMFRFAAAAKPLHRRFADKAAAVDGEMVDVSAIWRSCAPSAASAASASAGGRTIDREATARRRSLLYLDRLRMLHAGVTVVG